MDQQRDHLKAVLGRHEDALLREDTGAIAENYDEDAVLVVNGDVHVGRLAIQAFYAGLIKSLPTAVWHTDRARFVNDMAYVEWSCRSPDSRVPFGVDTFVVGPDGIRCQTAWFNILDVE
jgi:uncharacterized protein (TIGR02246 family)